MSKGGENMNGYSATHLDRGPQELEERITANILEIISTPDGQDQIRRIKQSQIDFFAAAILRIASGKNREKTIQEFNELMVNLIDDEHFRADASEITNSREKLQNGFVVITPHFGIAKATKITPVELRQRCKTFGVKPDYLEKIGMPPNNEPFLLRAAAIYKTVFSALGGPKKVMPHELIMWYPYPFDELERDCGIVGIYLDREGQYAEMESRLDDLFNQDRTNNKLPVALMYPEAGTSGKRSEDGNPYNLDPLKTGFLVYAMHRGIPVVPIVQVVRGDSTFVTRILPPFEVSKNTPREVLQEMAEKTRQDMQETIDSLLSLP